MNKLSFNMPVAVGFVVCSLLAAVGIVAAGGMDDGAASVADSAISDGEAQAAANESGRVLFIDPVTGKPRAPTAREAQEFNNRLQRSVQAAPVQEIKNPDGSTTIYMNRRERSVLQLSVEEDGSNNVRHGQNDQASAIGGQE